MIAALLPPKPPADLTGHNNPPLERAEDLALRLEKEAEDLLVRAANMDFACAGVPALLETAEHAELATDAIARAKAVLKETETFRVEQKAPYLAGVRVVDNFAAEISAPLGKTVENLTARLNNYQRVQREKEAAEQRERERLKREEEARAREAERVAQEAARRAEQEAQEAARRIREANDAEGREKAAQAMREAEARAAEQRAMAEASSKDAAQAARTAEVASKASSGQIGAAARVTSGGSTAGTTRYWSHAIQDSEKLMASLGPLGPHFSNDAISTALSTVSKTFGPAKDGAKPGVEIPGVRYFVDFRTSVGTKR